MPKPGKFLIDKLVDANDLESILNSEDLKNCSALYIKPKKKMNFKLINPILQYKLSPSNRNNLSELHIIKKSDQDDTTQTEIQVSDCQSIGYTHIDSDSAQLIHDALEAQNCQLKVLKLHNILITQENMDKITSALKSPHCKLENLDFNNFNFSLQTIKNITSGLKSENSTLKCLYLYKIKNELFSHIISNIESSNLEELYVVKQSGNNQQAIDLAHKLLSKEYNIMGGFIRILGTEDKTRFIFQGIIFGKRLVETYMKVEASNNMTYIHEIRSELFDAIVELYRSAYELQTFAEMRTFIENNKRSTPSNYRSLKGLEMKNSLKICNDYFCHLNLANHNPSYRTKETFLYYYEKLALYSHEISISFLNMMLSLELEYLSNPDRSELSDNDQERISSLFKTMIKLNPTAFMGTIKEAKNGKYNSFTPQAISLGYDALREDRKFRNSKKGFLAIEEWALAFVSENKLNFAELYNVIQENRHIDKSSLLFQLVKVMFFEKSHKDESQLITLSHEDNNMRIAQKFILLLNLIKRDNFKKYTLWAIDQIDLFSAEEEKRPIEASLRSLGLFSDDKQNIKDSIHSLQEKRIRFEALNLAIGS